MIASLTGTLTYKSPTEILIEVHGVGYHLHIPLSTYEKLGDTGASISPVDVFSCAGRHDAVVRLFYAGGAATFQTSHFCFRHRP